MFWTLGSPSAVDYLHWWKWSRSVVSDDPMNCSPPGSPVHGIFQVRVLEWGAIAFSNLIKLFMPKTSFISVKTIKVDYVSHTIYKNLKPQNPYKKTQAVYFLSLVLAIHLWICWMTREAKTKINGTYWNLKPFAQQGKPSTKLKASTLHGRRYLQTMYLIRG